MFDQKHRLLAIQTVTTVVLLAWILLWLDRIGEPLAWLVAILIVLAGDLATAAAMERLAPTEIKVEPGEHGEPVGRAIADFRHGAGRVQLRGERWQARCSTGTAIAKGAAVRVIGRDGLTLVVEPVPR